MRRTCIAAVLAAIVSLGGISTAGAAESWRWDECRFQYADDRAGWNVQEVRRTIRCAAPKFGVSTSTALYVADRESNFNPHATNAYSGACGVYQHIPRYFGSRLASVPARYREWGTSCYDARSNVLAAMRLAQGGWGPWGI